MRKKTASKKVAAKKTFRKKVSAKKVSAKRTATKKTSAATASTGERIQKVLARAGFGSRREIEGWISQGRVMVNGKPAQLGDTISSQDRVKLNGKLIPAAQLHARRSRVIMYHKPEGEICSRFDPEGRPTVFDNLPRIRGGRWVAVGRLDFNTSGLLLFTTDGQLANRLMHPSQEVEREYAVRILGEVTVEQIRNLKEGVLLEDGVAKFIDIIDAGGQGANHWYHVTLKEGKNREVRRLWESQGVKVSRLTRIRYGKVKLPRGLRAGHWRELDDEQIQSLRASLK